MAEVLLIDPTVVVALPGCSAEEAVLALLTISGIKSLCGGDNRAKSMPARQTAVQMGLLLLQLLSASAKIYQPSEALDIQSAVYCPLNRGHLSSLA